MLMNSERNIAFSVRIRVMYPEHGVIEGFYFIAYGGVVFYSKGVIHPPWSIIGYPKYYPSPSGDRVSRVNGARYAKLSVISEQLKLARKLGCRVYYDEYVGAEAPHVELGFIEKILNPVEKAREVVNEEYDNVRVIRRAGEMLVDLIDNSGVSKEAIGLSGSILAGLYTESSDIDIVVYGENNGRRVYEYLKESIDGRGPYRRYDSRSIARVYESRAKETPIGFEEAVKQARRRVLEGLFKDTEYFIRLVKPASPRESYGMARYEKIGVSTLKAVVLDDSESIYTPCRYLVRVKEFIDGVKALVEEIYSLRGRFAEVARAGEEVIARGVIEKIRYEDGVVRYRLYLGYPGDYLIVKS